MLLQQPLIINTKTLNQLTYSMESRRQPSQADFNLIKSQSERTQKGAYEVIDVLDNSQIEHRGTYEIAHVLDVAIKYQANDPKALQGYKKDIECSMRLLREPSANIINIYKVEEIRNETTQQIDKAFVVMERGKHTLTDRINEPIEKKLKHIGDIAKGLDHLHKCGFVHRDLKAENVLITYGDVAKIFDFGASKHYGDLEEGKTFVYNLSDWPQQNNVMVNTQEAIGTHLFNPPEILLDEMEVRVIGSCDMWQFGLLIARFVWKMDQYASSKHYIDDCEKTKQKWMKNPNSDEQIKIPNFPRIGFENEEKLIELVKRCLYYHPDKRIKSSQFVKEYFSQVHKMGKIESTINVSEESFQTKVEVYTAPKTLTESTMRREMLRNFVEKCIKDLAHVNDKQKSQQARKALVRLAVDNLGFDQEKTVKLIEATLGMVDH